MTELQFLIDLLLNHKLSPGTKKLVAERIGTVEASFNKPTAPQHFMTPFPSRPSPLAQSPSTQRILDEMAMEQPVIIAPIPTAIAQTPAAAAALAQRQE